MLDLRAPLSVAIVLFDGAQLLDVSGPAQVFATANKHGLRQDDCYHVSLLSRAGGGIATPPGVVLETQPYDSYALSELDTLIIVGSGSVLDSTKDIPLQEWLLRAAGSARRICGIGYGVYSLAAAGLLEGRQVVTHWALHERLKRDFPHTRLVSDRIYLRDRHIWSTAGASTSIDMALELVQDDYGGQLAMDVAKHLVLFMRRHSNQAQLSVPLLAQATVAQRSSDHRFMELHAWMVANPHADLSVGVLADFMGMSKRTFSRRFLEKTGMTPAKAVEKIRLEGVRRMLEQPEHAIKYIALYFGFGNEERMRRAFTRYFGISPQDYRARCMDSRKTPANSPVSR